MITTGEGIVTGTGARHGEMSRVEMDECARLALEIDDEYRRSLDREDEDAGKEVGRAVS